MAKALNIYLTPCPAPNKGKYEIYREGKPTGELISNTGIRKLLTREQYHDFLEGDSIFYVPANKFRKRNHRSKNGGNKSIKLD
jgi:hypothetical protein